LLYYPLHHKVIIYIIDDKYKKKKKMGYTTEFKGSFTILPPVEEATYQLLYGLGTTRRMKRRHMGKKNGVEGEFYVVGDEKNVVDHNHPPRTQPSLWCGWLIQPDRKTIQWNGIEKFYHYEEWLLYIVKILKERGYTMKGKIAWRGEDISDTGTLHLTHSFLTVRWIDTRNMEFKSEKICL